MATIVINIGHLNWSGRENTIVEKYEIISKTSAPRLRRSRKPHASHPQPPKFETEYQLWAEFLKRSADDHRQSSRTKKFKPKTLKKRLTSSTIFWTAKAKSHRPVRLTTTPATSPWTAALLPLAGLHQSTRK